MIVAEGLTKRFAETLAVEDVSFEVHPGQVVGFLGHNGAGKTTTLRMVLGHIRPTSGRSTILGKPIDKIDAPLTKIGVLLDSGLHPGQTARNHLRVSAAVGGLGSDRIDFLLRLVGLDDDADRRTGGFSSGMRQRLGIATALLADPEVIILDEPATGLDPEGIRWLRSLLSKLAAGGRTILISSHQLAEVAQTVDHVLVMDRGSLVAQSSLQELVRRAGTEVLVRSPGAEVLAEELHRAGIATTSVSDGELRARNVPARVVTELGMASGVPLWEVRTETPSLEEAFFELTKQGRDGKGNGEPPSESRATAFESDPSEDHTQEAKGDSDALVEAEAALDRDLARQPALGGCRVVAFVAPAEGVGATTLSFLAADVLASGLGARTLALGLSLDGERLAMPAPSSDRTTLNLSDLLEDLPGFDEASRISPYVSVARSGAHTLCGPRRAEQLAMITREALEALLDFAGRFYEIIVLDVGGLGNGTLRSVLRRADQLVLIGAPDAVDALDGRSPVLDAIEAERSERATLVFNRVDPARAASLATGRGAGPHALVPHDRELIRVLNTGDFALEQVERSTRVALKRLGLVVAEGLR